MSRRTEESVDEITEALLTASRVLVALSARSIASVDDTITIPQFRTLVILSTRGPSNVAALAGILGVRPSTATRMVDRLVAAELIDRKPNPNSRRELIVELTARGHEIVAAVTERRREEIAVVVAELPEADRHGLVHALTAFAAAGGATHGIAEIESYQL
ncbi:MarR family winged helix-turn-helix transcriptional regulator [Nocardia brasiliensis]|uniref:MarR family winged helix-turn-helix transcriptional regulator n=1 Tax=Nocardia brasiliensis TaxID=37326 RepID=UPI001895C67C|nr:MarR family transcriptional regulator [Nocardia brasiliensis]MBF6126645.1 MarR family transcriptional regulator [Nocardia brasiliensis]